MRHRKVIAGIVGTLVALVAVFYLGGGWYFSNMIDSRALDGAAMRASYPGEYDLTVTAAYEGEVSLTATGDAEPPALRSGSEWGLRWDGGYGWVGPVMGGGGGQGGEVTRRFHLVDGALPKPGAAALLDSLMFSDAEHIPTTSHVEDVTIPGPLGDLPAWFWPGAGSTWAIVLHGNSMTRLDGARAVPIFERLGYPVLLPTYRNDPGAPQDPSGKLRYGLTEWQDLEASVKYALDNGATDVVLDGYSMGAGIVMALMQHSDLADKVTAIAMDAPMLNFSATVSDKASRETLRLVGLPLPASMTAVAKQLAAWRFGVDWSALDYGNSDPGVPTLIFHGTKDLTVPIATSEAFAKRYPDHVTLVRCPGAGHVACWNVDPRAYEHRLDSFVKENARVESAQLSCPPGSLLGGAQLDGAAGGAATAEAAIARVDPGDGTLVLLQRRSNRSRQADAEYVLVRDGFPVRRYSLDHSVAGWRVDSIEFCGDTGSRG